MYSNSCNVGCDDEERLWLVDNKDLPVGGGWQLCSDARAGTYRVINAFVRNSEGRVWIPRRSYTKKSFPGALDFSVGGHVSYPESYQQNFEREAFEELGVNLSRLNWRSLGKLSPSLHPVSSWMTVYEIITDDLPPLNLKEFVECSWLTPSELVHRIGIGEEAKSDLSYVASWYEARRESPII